MIKVVFKNLDPSELARNIVIERLEAIRTKFPDLEEHSMTITLVCENSSQQPGPDLFNVRLLINGPRYKNLVLAKAAPNLYTAAAKMAESVRR
jgi:hypothetical protein